MDYRNPLASHASYLSLRDWHALLDFPIDTEGIIEDADAAICLWMIELITLVLEDGCL